MRVTPHTKKRRLGVLRDLPSTKPCPEAQRPSQARSLSASGALHAAYLCVLFCHATKKQELETMSRPAHQPLKICLVAGTKELAWCRSGRRCFVLERRPTQTDGLHELPVGSFTLFCSAFQKRCKNEASTLLK